MQGYIILAIGFRFLVDAMLFMGVNKLTGVYANPVRSILGATAGSLYALCCFVPGLAFLNGVIYHILFLLLTCWAAFDIGKESFGKWLLYCLIKVSLECLAADLGGFVNVLCAAVLCGVCFWTVRGRVRKYLPVELQYGSSRVKLRALYDTGNLLRDPVTGKPVLIVGADVAEKLTGLSVSQLQNPVETMGAIPGLRLIPYHTVANADGFFLALRIQNVKIGKWQGSAVVAFAPRKLDEKFGALIGGTL